MPLEMGLWKIADGNTLQRMTKARLDSEKLLEDWIAEQPDILGRDLLIFGRQVRTDYGGVIDLLALDVDGRVHIIELKRGETPREIVAQALDYASWVVTIENDTINEICKRYLDKDIESAFREHFKTSPPEVLNEDHAMMIVASALDVSSERIVQYLAEHHELNINVVFFSIFGDGNGHGRMLGRSWLISPEAVEDRAEAKRERHVIGEWTGYYFVNVGETEAEGRNWDDCRRYGFIAGGQGDRYRRAMLKLREGDQIFAYVVGYGYVGYGIVTRPAVMAKDFMTASGPLLDQPLNGIAALALSRDDEVKAEYVVGVDWKTTVDRNNAKTFPGVFANQNIVCKIRDARTIQFLREQFHVAEPVEIAVASVM